jgi:ATP-binding cassette subfamily B protein
VSHQPFAQAGSGEGRPDSRPEPSPRDIPATPVSLRRIGRLFAPYRARLGGLLALIFLGAGLGVISPFLLRGVLDTAIPDHNTRLLTLLVAGMIALSIIG